MKRLQILAFNAYDDNVQDVSWGVGYESDSKLYGIIQEAREEYAEHCLTLYYDDGQVVTYQPLLK